MTISTFCSWDSHENCRSQSCTCECHVQGRKEWGEWQAHQETCTTCHAVVSGLRVGRCHTGDILVASWLSVIHVKERRE